MRSPPSSGQAPVHDPLPVLPAYYSSADGKQRFVGRLFDTGAGDYNRLDRFLAFGTGSRYRHQALIRGGLAPGIDPSAGMITGAAGGGIALVRGRAESLACAAGSGSASSRSTAPPPPVRELVPQPAKMGCAFVPQAIKKICAASTG